MTETTADMDVIHEEQPAPVKRDDSVVQPGDLSAKLKACREKAEMDLEQAAVEMRLSASMVRALEAEKFSDLPDPPYVRGYLRSYARLDGSDPKDLIRTYELLRGADPDSFALSPSTQLHRATKPVKPAMSPSTLKLLGLVLLVLFLGILSMIPGVSQWASDTWKDFSAKTAETLPPADNEALVAKLTQEPESTTASTAEDKPADNNTIDSMSATTTEPVTLATSTQDSISTDTTGVALTLPDTTSETEAEESASPDAELAAEEGQDTATPSTPETGSAATADTTTAETAATPPATTPATIAETTTIPITPADAAVAQAPANSETPPAPPAAAAQTQADPAQAAARQQPIDGEVLVRMEFTQEVWMQVRDGNKKSIFEAVNTAGTWKQFKARTPLSFKVGNSAGVRIYLNGQLFDQTPYSRGSVARFNID